MKEHRFIYPVMKMCKVLIITRSAYYKWLKRVPSIKKKEDEKLKKEMQFIYGVHKGNYGLPRITEELRKNGYIINKKRVSRLMNELGLKAKRKRKKYQKQNKEGIEFNVLQQDFTAERPDEKWVSDITETRTKEGKIYICAILDLCSRNAVGYEIKSRRNATVITHAFFKAEIKRNIKEGMIFHSDKGSEYRSEELKKELRIRGINQSMSGKGNCYDNAVMESFFSTLKREFLNKYRFETLKALSIELEKYMYYYNNIRLHSTLGYISPIEFEEKNKTLNCVST